MPWWNVTVARTMSKFLRKRTTLRAWRPCFKSFRLEFNKASASAMVQVTAPIILIWSVDPPEVMHSILAWWFNWSCQHMQQSNRFQETNTTYIFSAPSRVVGRSQFCWESYYHVLCWSHSKGKIIKLTTKTAVGAVVCPESHASAFKLQCLEWLQFRFKCLHWSDSNRHNHPFKCLEWLQWPQSSVQVPGVTPIGTIISSSAWSDSNRHNHQSSAWSDSNRHNHQFKCLEWLKSARFSIAWYPGPPAIIAIHIAIP